MGQLLVLDSDNSEKPIHMYINRCGSQPLNAEIWFLGPRPAELVLSSPLCSPGGSVSAGLAIYDTMQYINSPVSTVCMGQACSMGSLLLAAGEKGHRKCLPHASVMLHQPSGGAYVCVFAPH